MADYPIIFVHEVGFRPLPHVVASILKVDVHVVRQSLGSNRKVLYRSVVTRTLGELATRWLK